MLRILLVRDMGDSSLPTLEDAAGFFVARGHFVTAAGSLPEVRMKSIQARIHWIVCWRGELGGVVDEVLQSDIAVPGSRVRILVVGERRSSLGATVSESEWVVRLEAGASLEQIAAVLERRRPEGRSASSQGLLEVPVNMFRLAPEVEPLVGSCAAVAAVVEKVKKVAETNSTVLLLGESGTGKELIARSIHYRSPRASRPLVTVNCGAIPLALLESELFGYEQGAFTGARVAKKGLLGQADGGTVFLDEVGELPLELQVKLLRFLQEGEIAPIGGDGPIKVDVRVISATNRDLEALVEKRMFREDLYYRLAVIPIRLPPLRERKEDIAQLLQHFLARSQEKTATPVRGFAPDALEALAAYDWPGNVREIRNFVERLAVLSDGPVVGLENLPESIRRHAPPPETAPVVDAAALHGGLAKAVANFERTLIARALEETGGNQKQAAERLGVGRTTLIAKAKKLGLL